MEYPNLVNKYIIIRSGKHSAQIIERLDHGLQMVQEDLRNQRKISDSLYLIIHNKYLKHKE
jgi:hypothetical protein